MKKLLSLALLVSINSCFAMEETESSSAQSPLHKLAAMIETVEQESGDQETRVARYSSNFSEDIVNLLLAAARRNSEQVQKSFNTFMKTRSDIHNLLKDQSTMESLATQVEINNWILDYEKFKGDFISEPWPTNNTEFTTEAVEAYKAKDFVRLRKRLVYDFQTLFAPKLPVLLEASKSEQRFKQYSLQAMNECYNQSNTAYNAHVSNETFNIIAALSLLNKEKMQSLLKYVEG